MFLFVFSKRVLCGRIKERWSSIDVSGDNGSSGERVEKSGFGK